MATNPEHREWTVHVIQDLNDNEIFLLINSSKTEVEAMIGKNYKIIASNTLYEGSLSTPLPD